jgi:hypothetical protein
MHHLGRDPAAFAALKADQVAAGAILPSLRLRVAHSVTTRILPVTPFVVSLRHSTTPL